MYVYINHTKPLGDTIGKSHSTAVVDDLMQFSGTLATPINMCCCMLKNGSPIELIYSIENKYIQYNTAKLQGMHYMHKEVQ